MFNFSKNSWWVKIGSTFKASAEFKKKPIDDGREEYPLLPWPPVAASKQELMCWIEDQQKEVLAWLSHERTQTLSDESAADRWSHRELKNIEYITQIQARLCAWEHQILSHHSIEPSTIEAYVSSISCPELALKRELSSMLIHAQSDAFEKWIKICFGDEFESVITDKDINRAFDLHRKLPDLSGISPMADGMFVLSPRQKVMWFEAQWSSMGPNKAFLKKHESWIDFVQKNQSAFMKDWKEKPEAVPLFWKTLKEAFSESQPCEQIEEVLMATLMRWCEESNLVLMFDELYRTAIEHVPWYSTSEVHQEILIKSIWENWSSERKWWIQTHLHQWLPQYPTWEEIPWKKLNQWIKTHAEDQEEQISAWKTWIQGLDLNTPTSKGIYPIEYWLEQYPQMLPLASSLGCVWDQKNKEGLPLIDVLRKALKDNPPHPVMNPILDEVLAQYEARRLGQMCEEAKVELLVSSMDEPSHPASSNKKRL